jgi:3-oxoacyl-[acyl-carrier protein] reductase
MRRKTALITGGARGIGKMIALRLAEDGYNIALNYLKSEIEAINLAGELEKLGAEVLILKGDITDLSYIPDLVNLTLKEFGSIETLITNAGPFIHERKPFSEYSREEMRYMINGHLLGVMEIEHLVLPIMQQQQFGRIIHIGLDKAHEGKGYPLRSVYAAARVGLMSLTKTLSVEEESNNITVNMICIGDIKDPYKEMDIKTSIKEAMDKGVPTRSGTGEDISRLTSFLCSPESSFITGAIIDVNGGIDPVYKKAQLLKKLKS